MTMTKVYLIYTHISYDGGAITVLSARVIIFLPLVTTTNYYYFTITKTYQ